MRGMTEFTYHWRLKGFRKMKPNVVKCVVTPGTAKILVETYHAVAHAPGQPERVAMEYDLAELEPFDVAAEIIQGFWNGKMFRDEVDELAALLQSIQDAGQAARVEDGNGYRRTLPKAKAKT